MDPTPKSDGISSYLLNASGNSQPTPAAKTLRRVAKASLDAVLNSQPLAILIASQPGYDMIVQTFPRQLTCEEVVNPEGRETLKAAYGQPLGFPILALRRQVFSNAPPWCDFSEKARDTKPMGTGSDRGWIPVVRRFMERVDAA
jgi:hypothetical protein